MGLIFNTLLLFIPIWVVLYFMVIFKSIEFIWNTKTGKVKQTILELEFANSTNADQEILEYKNKT